MILGLKALAGSGGGERGGCGGPLCTGVEVSFQCTEEQNDDSWSK